MPAPGGASNLSLPPEAVMSAQSSYQASSSVLEQAMWLVHVEGGDRVVGPVSAAQIAWGIRAGQVPSHATVQREGDVFWTGILDEPVVIEALKAG